MSLHIHSMLLTVVQTCQTAHFLQCGHCTQYQQLSSAASEHVPQHNVYIYIVDNYQAYQNHLDVVCSHTCDMG